MNLQSKHKISNVQANFKEQTNPLINLESNAKIFNSLIEKQQETLNKSQEKTNAAAYSTNILNSKDIEIFNNIANKLTNDSAISSTQKKKNIANKNSSCEKIKSLIDTKNKEMEIYNKINNFSLKYSNGQSSQNSNLNSSALLSQRSARKKSQADHLISNNNSKSNSKNATPNKKNNLLTNLNNNININNLNNISNASFNNSLLLHGLNNKNSTINNNNNNNTNYNTVNENLSKFNNTLNSQTNTPLTHTTTNNPLYLSTLKHKKTSDLLAPHKISKITPITPEDFENCEVSDEYDHLPQAPNSAVDQQINRSIVLKPKPPLELNDYLIKELCGKSVIQEEKEAEDYLTVIEGEFKPAAYAPTVKSAFYESKKNFSNNDFDLGNINNNNINNNNAFCRDDEKAPNAFVDAERNNKELLKALTHMEQEMNKSEFNNALHSKSLISNNAELAKHFENYDLTNLSYDLVKEYSHLKINKDEEFMKRMLFDIFKRQTKDDRLEKILEKNKVKMDENDRIRAFNRLIEDANRRLEAQENIEDLKVKLNKGPEDEKNYTNKDWEEIYQQRFMNYQSYRENWIRERQSEKERIAKEKELEIIKSCKTVKKPKKNIEEFCNRMYEEAKRREIKNLKKKENYANEQEKEAAANTNNPAPGVAKINKIEKNENNNKKANLDSNKDKSKGKNTKPITNYNFQSDFNSNQISENVTNKQFSKLATFREQSKKSLNSSLEFIRNLNESPIKKNRNSKSKENLNASKSKIDTTPIKQRKESETKLSNTELNNVRFECDPSESKKNLFRNSSSLLSVSQENRQKDLGVYEFTAHKSPNKVEDYTSNLFSANIKNMHEIQNNNFDISDEDIIQDVPKPYRMRTKKPSYKLVPMMFSNTQMKFLPDHVAINVVDNILNPKFYDD